MDKSSRSIFKQTMRFFGALEYLEKRTIINVNLEPKNILLTNRQDDCISIHKNGLDNIINSPNLKLKLYGYGLGHMTNYGEFVAFPVFINPAFTPPEMFLENPVVPGAGDEFADHWRYPRLRGPARQVRCTCVAP